MKFCYSLPHTFQHITFRVRRVLLVEIVFYQEVEKWTQIPYLPAWTYRKICLKDKENNMHGNIFENNHLIVKVWRFSQILESCKCENLSQKHADTVFTSQDDNESTPHNLKKKNHWKSKTSSWRFCRIPGRKGEVLVPIGETKDTQTLLPSLLSHRKKNKQTTINNLFILEILTKFESFCLHVVTHKLPVVLFDLTKKKFKTSM